jgi:hypothetical protein
MFCVSVKPKSWTGFMGIIRAPVGGAECRPNSCKTHPRGFTQPKNSFFFLFFLNYFFDENIF